MSMNQIRKPDAQVSWHGSSGRRSQGMFGPCAFRILARAVRTAACVTLLMASVIGAEPVVFTTQHVDIRVRYQPEVNPSLDLVARNEDARPPLDYPATNAVLIVAEPAKVELPSDLPPLGNGGDPIWVLPSSQREGLLYLGLSAEENPLGVFDGPVEVRLLSVDGPGHFFVWQAELGALQFWMNSRDGVGPDDVYRQLVGGHSHADWGFTTSGVYRLTFQATAHRLGEPTNLLSEPATFTFHVLPLPAAAATPFQQWQAREWPGVTDPSVIGAGADPDGDRLPNLWEYALGRSPRAPDAAPFPGVSVTLDGAGPAAHVLLRIPRTEAAVDLEYRVLISGRPDGPWEVQEFDSEVVPGGKTGIVVVFRDRRPVMDRATAFYRVDVQLKNQP